MHEKNATTGLPASIHQRLLNKAQKSGRPFNELLQYYGIERFLYRLSLSDYADQFILKGALMFNVWGMEGFRPTRDIDLLGHTSNAIDTIKDIFQSICRIRGEADGLEFDANSVRCERIKEDADYEGIRVTLAGALGKIRIHIQIDIGFADIVTPPPMKMDYPTILDHSSPRLYGYSRESVIAEKFQAMTALGNANSRLKDFYDVWMLVTNFTFDGRTLKAAIEKTFQNRSTELPDSTHAIFSKGVHSDKRRAMARFYEEDQRP